MNWDQLLTLLQGLGSEFIGAAFSLLVALALFIFRPRVRLLWGRLSTSINRVDVPNPEGGEGSSVEFYVEKFVVQNNGSQAATNVEFVLNRKPTDLNVLSPRQHETSDLPKGEYQVSIKSIAPKETVAIDCIYVNQLASIVATVRCDQAVGRFVPFDACRQFPRWFSTMLWLLTFAGVAFLAQLVSKIF